MALIKLQRAEIHNQNCPIEEAQEDLVEALRQLNLKMRICKFVSENEKLV